MKKLFSLILAFALCAALLAGCGGAASSTPASSAPVAPTPQAPPASPAPAAPEVPAITQAELESLVECNFDCMVNIFVLGNLEAEAWPENPQSEEDYIVKVAPDRFETFADLETYVRSVYAAEYADHLLYHYPQEDAPLYQDRDGELYIDLMRSGGKGYYVNWWENEVVIDSCEGGECQFRILTTIEEPADVPTPEPYEIAGTAVYQNSQWVLTDMLF
ncbi:MAG: hypothetical protein IIV90_07855 [Oscillospiraceae bacterium]|nr:hypothetical protein [Oscillospiraceae bacterium]